MHSSSQWEVLYNIDGVYNILSVQIYPPGIESIASAHCCDTYKEVHETLIKNYKHDIRFYCERDNWFNKIYIIEGIYTVKLDINDVIKLYPDEFI